MLESIVIDIADTQCLHKTKQSQGDFEYLLQIIYGNSSLLFTQPTELRDLLIYNEATVLKGLFTHSGSRISLRTFASCHK